MASHFSDISRCRNGSQWFIEIYRVDDNRRTVNTSTTHDEAQSIPKSKRDINSAKMHFWSKFGNPDNDTWWLMVRTNSQAQTGVNIDFKIKFYLAGQVQSIPKQWGSSPRSFTPVVEIWRSQLEWVMSYRTDKFGDGRTNGQTTDGRTDGRTDAGNDSTLRPKLASGKSDAILAVRIA